MSQDEAWAKLAEEEANALAMMLERPDRKVMVVVIGTDGAQGWMVQGVSAETRRSHGNCFVSGLRRKVAKLSQRLEGTA